MQTNTQIGPVSIEDYTNQAQVIPRQVQQTDGTIQTLFAIKFGDLIASFPADKLTRWSPFLLQNPKKLTFQTENGYLKITETEETGRQATYYGDIDPTSIITRKSQKTNAPPFKTFNIFKYLPQHSFTKEDAAKKCTDLKTRFPALKVEKAVYNEHGVAIFCLDATEEVFLYATPTQEKVEKIATAVLTIDPLRSDYFAVSADASTCCIISPGEMGILSSVIGNFEDIVTPGTTTNDLKEDKSIEFVDNDGNVQTFGRKRQNTDVGIDIGLLPGTQKKLLNNRPALDFEVEG